MNRIKKQLERCCVLRNRIALLLVVLLLVSFSALALAAERHETIIVGGGSWSPATSWNPLYPNHATGTVGLVYEPLFHYNPVTNEHKPWLVTRGEWISDTVWEIELRSEPYWADGTPLTAADVVFTYELARDNELTYSPIWRTLKEVKAISSRVVQFVFKNPTYQEWQMELYSRPIIPKHIWENVASDDLMVLTNSTPIGSGPYKPDYTGADRNVWVRDDNWWGIDVF